MARLKKDDTGWKASGLKKKYDENRSYDGATGRRRKKDKKKWCGGRVGKKHVPILSKRRRYDVGSKRNQVMQVVCKNCGKVFEIDWGFRGRQKKGKEVLLKKWTEKLGS